MLIVAWLCFWSIAFPSLSHFVFVWREMVLSGVAATEDFLLIHVATGISCVINVLLICGVSVMLDEAYIL